MGVLIQTKVGQVHVKIFDIRMVRLLVVVGAESGETLVAQISLHWVDTPDQHVKSHVKFLPVENQGVIDVSLD